MGSALLVAISLIACQASPKTSNADVSKIIVKGLEERWAYMDKRDENKTFETVKEKLNYEKIVPIQKELDVLKKYENTQFKDENVAHQFKNYLTTLQKQTEVYKNLSDDVTYTGDDDQYTIDTSITEPSYYIDESNYQYYNASAIKQLQALNKSTKLSVSDKYQNNLQRLLKTDTTYGEAYITKDALALSDIKWEENTLNFKYTNKTIYNFDQAFLTATVLNHDGKTIGKTQSLTLRGVDAHQSKTGQLEFEKNLLEGADRISINTYQLEAHEGLNKNQGIDDEIDMDLKFSKPIVIKLYITKKENHSRFSFL
ncbi:hypothetical protein [Sharpea azabuensis]